MRSTWKSHSHRHEERQRGRAWQAGLLLFFIFFIIPLIALGPAAKPLLGHVPFIEPVIGITLLLIMVAGVASTIWLAFHRERYRARKDAVTYRSGNHLPAGAGRAGSGGAGFGGGGSPSGGGGMFGGGGASGTW